MRAVRASLHRLKQHELHTTLRASETNFADWQRNYLALCERQATLLSQTSKQLIALLATYLAIYNLSTGSALELSVASTTIRVPAAFALLGVAFQFLIVSFYTLSWLCLLSFTSKYEPRPRQPRFSKDMFGLLNGHNDLALSTPFARSRIWSPNKTYDVLGFLYLLVAIGLLSPVFALTAFILNSAISSANAAQSIISFEFVSSILAVALISYAYSYVVFFYAPLRHKKNKMFIRWGMLVHDYPRGKHPMLERWLRDESD